VTVPNSEKGLNTSAAAFDNVAARYDVESTDILLSRWFRAIVWEQMTALFPPGSHVLELGCGTGEDAVWNARRGVHVTATDASPAMREQTRQKAVAAGVDHLITIQPLDFTQTDQWSLPENAFDGVYSNYGALNCVGDWTAIGAQLSRAVKPGGKAGLCVIGRVCPWEMLWHGTHLHFRTAFRRLSGQTMAHLDGHYFPVYYPLPRRLARDFGTDWRWQRVQAVGVWLPPSDLYAGVGKRPAIANRLLQLERLTAKRWPFTGLGDHYWLELTRSNQG
jgi:ubiquinone/menaquinone biosynthesis C-methylase UbiE